MKELVNWKIKVIIYNGMGRRGVVNVEERLRDGDQCFSDLNGM